jgi:hypothetical protein
VAIKLLIGTEDVPQLKNQIDDDNGSWWGGVHLVGSRLALAGALAASALTTGLAQQVVTQQQDDPARIAVIEEEYWRQSVPSASPTFLRQAFIDEELGTQLAFSPEEDSWKVILPQQSATLAQIVYDTDEAIQVAVQNAIDEDYWPTPIYPPAVAIQQPYSSQDELVSVLDEDYWFQVLPVPPTQVAQPWFHQDEVFPATSFGPEEDYWPRSSQVGNSYLARIFQEEGDLIGTPIVVATSTATDPEIHLFKLNYTNKMHKL